MDNLVSQARRSQCMRGKMSGYFRQVFVDVTGMLVTPIRLQNIAFIFCIGHMISIF